MVDNIFFNIGVILGTTVVLGFLMRILRQPLIIAYLVAGILCGPLLFHVVSPENHFFGAFARFGVVLLLFAVGLGLNFPYLRTIGKVALVTGGGQVIFTASIGSILLLALDFSFFSAAFLAVAITFSSTIIIMKLLSDKHDLQSVYGRYTVGLMLVQDAIAVMIMILLPLLAVQENVVTSLAFIVVKSVGVIVIVMLVARFVLPFVISRVAESAEFLFIFTIAWCFIVAGLAEWVGLSLEIGAIMAGMSLGSSTYQTEIASRIKPLRDFFIVLFFILLGSEITLGGAREAMVPGVVLAIFVLVGNPLILYILYRWMKFTRRNSFLAGLTAAQVSEFGFVLLFLGQRMGHITNRELSVFTITALTTIFCSSYLIIYNQWLYGFLQPIIRKIFGKDKRLTIDHMPPVYDAWVFGYHRMGWKICQGLAATHKKFGVVDYNPAAVAKLQQRRFPAFFGDASDVEFLAELPLDRAQLIISTIPDDSDQLTLIKHVRLVNPTAVIICTLDYNARMHELYAAGADYVMLPHLLSGEWAVEVLKTKKWTKGQFRLLQHRQQRELQLRAAAGANHLGA